MKALLLLFVLLTTGFTSFSQINTTLSRNYGGPGYEQMYRFYQSSDGGFYWCGYTKAAGGNIPSVIGGDDAWFMKVDASGDSVHSAVFGGTSDDYLKDFLEVTSTNYVLLMESMSTDNGFAGGHGSNDVWIKGYDFTAGLSAGAPFGGSLYDQASRITPKNAGGYIFAGSTASSDGNLSGNYGSSDIWIMSLQSNLAIAWSRHYGGSGEDRGIAAYQLIDGNIMVFGTTLSNNFDVHGNNGNNDVFVMKLNSMGDTLWTKTYGGSSTDIIKEAKMLNDSTFVFIGNSNSNDGDFMFREDKLMYYYGFYYVIDDNGNYLHAGSVATLDNADMTFTDAVVDSANHAVAFGITESDSIALCNDQNHGLSDIFIADFNGITDFNAYFMGGSDIDGVDFFNEKTAKAVRTGSNQIAFCTNTRSITLAPDFHGMMDVWLSIIEVQHLSVPEASQLQLSVYPNPADNIIKIGDINSSDIAQFEVFDMQGKLLLHGQYSESGIDISSLENGMYLLKLKSGDSTGIARIVKQ
ncbi:MAG: hypothetical protein A2W93_11305 [Bacteroidetes bacterium GWF2_43_63]|nr:MAG: hypothetical protein A2W94_14180 [Bacteroidetes bacterium GWE2_42_42]OFY54860.1 MAG: hypothetical protein A2W93_11305 [Bacteroidetes bacterium GWF2_43_63]HCB63236.1 hypothetical protein [Bacteroidales bacterium]HCY21978.1 hypothetical protein [Bacteroidales bacterium]